MKVEMKEHFFLNRHVKKKKRKLVLSNLWLKAGKEHKRSDACGPCPKTHLTHCVDLFPFDTKFIKIMLHLPKILLDFDLYVVERLEIPDEGFKRKSSYNGVILGDLSKILHSSSFIALHLAPCGCSTHGG